MAKRQRMGDVALPFCVVTRCAVSWSDWPCQSCLPALSKDGVRILSACDRCSLDVHFQRGIYQISPGAMRQCSLEECALLSRRDIGNDDNQSGVQRFLGIKFCKVHSVVRHEGIFSCLDLPHQFPVLLTTQSKEVHMFAKVSSLVSDFDE